MVAPYVSTRTGSGQWLMQRVSAVLLIGLAFAHFGIQHFTSDAVSTGLTVSARANNPWWQGYYIVFVILALYHGVNGVVGIVRDYNPRPLARIVGELVLWSLAVYYGAVGIQNFVTPRPLGEVKELYARNGFPVGESAGNPPIPGGGKTYDFRNELRELHLLAYYLEHHTHRPAGQALDLAQVFGHGGDPARSGTAPEQVIAAGRAFDEWCLAEARTPALLPEQRERHATFSSQREFAVWASNVRIANAALRRRLDKDGVQPTSQAQRDADAATVARLDGVALPYSSLALH